MSFGTRYRRDVPHGLMFHHFHGDGHRPSQGSISAEEFADLLDFVGRRRILPAAEWFERARAGRLRPDDLCVTFDDALRCQYDVARPVLHDLGLTAFYFVYTCIFAGEVGWVEIYRHLRTAYYESVDDFYIAFEAALEASPHGDRCRTALKSFDPNEYLRDFPFYTATDRRFRFLRNEVLGLQAYAQVMDAMVAASGMRVEDVARQLWVDAEALRHLDAEGNVIGLHSHRHFTRIASLPADAQVEEYGENRRQLVRILGRAPVAMAHPSNSYGPDTLRILRAMGVEVGFRANMACPEGGGLEWPREDHANLLAMRRR